MIELEVSIERSGMMVPVGMLTGDDAADTVFRYDPAYRSSPEATAVSISLPLQEEPFTPIQTTRFFDGLLPEGYLRRTLAEWMRVPEGDYISILHALGRECLGALRIAEKGEPSNASYERLSSGQIRQLAEEGVSRSIDLVIQSRLSLTGASGKVGLYYDSSNNAWYLPHGMAASTHIVKQSHVRLGGIVTNEQLCLMTAAACRINVPHSFIINTGKKAESDVLFATERYDRQISEEVPGISGLPRPLRLHQEDFAQAMGISASDKYESAGGLYMKRMFDILRQYSANPIEDQLKLWDRIVFNCLIGNADGHIKNYSLLYGSDLKSIRLAPAYDIVSTAVYEGQIRQLAFRIGDALTLDDINEEDFRKAAKETGLGERMAMKHYEDMKNRLPGALASCADRLAEEGYEGVYEIKDRILKYGSLSRI